MLNKLRNKIFWILQITLTVIVLGIIFLYLVLNYKTLMETASNIIDRYTDEMGANADSREEVKKEEVYSLLIVDSQVENNPDDAGDDIQNIAIKAVNKGNTTGVIDDYIYKIREKEKDSYIITLAKNDTITSSVKNLYFYSGIASVLAIIVIFFVSRQIASIIVKPITETFEKQKQFVSDASHELKTPISIIEVNAEMAEEKLGESKYIKYIQSEAESMNKLINSLLILAKTEKIDDAKNYEVFNLSEEIKLDTLTFEAIGNEKNIRINTKIMENIEIRGFQEDFKHILSILLDNAIKHTKQGGEVTVELSKEKNEIILQVKNEGEPIPKEEQNKIFERFYRVDKSRNREEGRYGLGLAIAKAIVEKYTGKIEVNCKNGITNFIIII